MRYDAIIVGGGPAGLSAALLLGRCGRRVLVCDSGAYRNARSSKLSGFLSRDGVDPAELLRCAREQLRPYCVSWAQCRVTDATRSDDGFTVVTSDGERPTARALVLATGLVDHLPQVPGAADLYGKSIFTCPYCDAWEVRGTPLAVLGAGGAELARTLRAWSDDVVLLTDDEVGGSVEERAELAALGVRVEAARVARFVGRAGELERVEFADGRALPRRAVFLALGHRQSADLASRLGVKIEDPQGGQHAPGATGVPHLYVVGDMTGGASLAIIAAAEGAKAAQELHTALQREDEQRARDRP